MIEKNDEFLTFGNKEFQKSKELGLPKNIFGNVEEKASC
jgi:hypothetical protein